MTQYALDLGLKLNFKISELDELILVPKLHDIGKIGIGEDIKELQRCSGTQFSPTLVH